MRHLCLASHIQGPYGTAPLGGLLALLGHTTENAGQINALRPTLPHHKPGATLLHALQRILQVQPSHSALIKGPPVVFSVTISSERMRTQLPPVAGLAE